MHRGAGSVCWGGSLALSLYSDDVCHFCALQDRFSLLESAVKSYQLGSARPSGGVAASGEGGSALSMPLSLAHRVAFLEVQLKKVHECKCWCKFVHCGRVVRVCVFVCACVRVCVLVYV